MAYTQPSYLGSPGLLPSLGLEINDRTQWLNCSTNPIPQATESLIQTSSGQVALDHAVLAAELYMRAAGEAANKKDAARLRLKCQQLIAQAEKLKAQLNQTPSILLQTSRLHANLFPPWSKEPSDRDFQLVPGEEPFTLGTPKVSTRP